MDGLRVIVVAVLISKRVLEWRAGDVLGQLLVLRRGTVMISEKKVGENEREQETNSEAKDFYRTTEALL